MNSRFGHLARTLIAAVSLAGMTHPALADIQGFWLGGNTFFYNVSNLPDIDQRRGGGIFVNNVPIIGLPGDGGMYCVPTSSMDLLAYIANHGFPNVAPNPGDWSLSPPDASYNYMTGQLANLGAIMGTDPVKGTNYGQASVADQAVLDQAYPGDFAVSWDGASGYYCPLLPDVAQIAIFGSLLTVGIGFYDQPLPDFDHWHRAGGHSLALSRADSLGYIGWSDPASDENPHYLWGQSAFSQDVYPITNITALFGEGDGSDPSIYFQRTEARIGFGNAYLDGYLSITPKYALAWDGDQLVATYPTNFVLPEGPKQLKYTTVGGKKVLDVVINPVRTQHPYIVQDSNAVWLLQTLDGTSSRFAEVDHPQRIAQGGRNLNLYVVCPEHLVCFDRLGRRSAQAHLRVPLAAIAYDDFRDHVIGVSTMTNELFVFDPMDLHMMSRYPLPDGVSGHGERVTLSANPRTGVLYIQTDGSNKVTLATFREVGMPAFGQVTLFGTESPTGFFVDERGMFFVTDRGMVKSFFPSGMPAERNRFAGFTGGQIYQIVRPHNNFDPALANSPSFFNVLPENAPR